LLRLWRLLCRTSRLPLWCGLRRRGLLRRLLQTGTGLQPLRRILRRLIARRREGA
jgi:hypothetical protein